MIIDNVAIVMVTGFLAKAPMFSGTSTLDLRAQLGELATNDEVQAVLLYIDSPGGQVAGTDELATDVAHFPKPIHVFAADLMASAAFWIGAGAKSITCNRLCQVGSVGVFATAEDWSEAYQKQGVRVHVIASGPRKAEGQEGVPIAPEYLRDIKTTVDEMFGVFRDAVLSGRRITDANRSEVLSGAVWTARRAQQLGLVDAIGGLSEALAKVRTDTKAARARRNIMNGF